jgi:hypothetical protein
VNAGPAGWIYDDRYHCHDRGEIIDLYVVDTGEELC